MFLRGYGSQKYNEKVLSSGETGKIQSWGSPRVILDAQFTSSTNIHGQSLNDFKYIGGNQSIGNWLSSLVHGQTASGNNFIYTYKYTINSMSPCGIASINEEFENEIFIWPVWSQMNQFDSTWKVPDANEVRPVNVAVRYYIKAK